MNDETYTYIATQRERKSLKNSARYKKSGSHSKRCSLPHDRLTAKQLRERNGEIMEYKLSEPMSWNTFKSMPKDLQIEYLQKCVFEHEGKCKEIAEMFLIASSTLSDYIGKHLGVRLWDKPKFGPPSEKWLAFVNGTEESSDEPVVEELSTPIPEENIQHSETSQVKQASTELSLTNGELCFTGKPEDAFFKAMLLFDKDTVYNLRISFYKDEKRRE